MVSFRAAGTAPYIDILSIVSSCGGVLYFCLYLFHFCTEHQES